ncbi:LysR family transcriptional regulator [Amycolatopsis nigrescens]|uniref:LysR family transcriptional regulator n=1 Tax=Amycolatopsis nigrescens TaxID=381445 RepID=UPI0003A8C8EC|nr:LysR substrate-binding domain-containing protein [Amycolatopsis nigrescens]
MTVDLRKLEHFVAVVEELGFTRAAARLHLSQQALSTSIRALERDVGTPLLDRTGQQTVVLPAGRALYEDARALLAAAEAATSRARRIGQGERGPLRIGHTPAVTAQEITGLLGALRAADPEIPVTVRQLFPGSLAERLLAGEIDLALGRVLSPPRGLAAATIGEHRLRVAVRAGHRLAGRDWLEGADLAGERLMLWAPPGHSGYTDLLLGELRRAGAEPEFEVNPVQGTPPVTAVLGNDCFALVTAPPGPAADGAVRVLDLRPAVFVPLQAMWLDSGGSEVRDAFLAAAKAAVAPPG